MKRLLTAILLAAVAVSAGCSKPKEQIDITVYNDSSSYNFKVTDTSNGSVLEESLVSGSSAVYTVIKGDCLEYAKLSMGSPIEYTDECYQESATVHLN